MRRAALLAAVVLAGCGGGVTSSSRIISNTTTATTTAQGALGPPTGPLVNHARNRACGTELWAKKTLQDPGSARVDPYPANAPSIAALNAVPDTGAQGASRVGVELHVYRFTGRLVEFKLEADSDYHVVMADSTGKTIVTEYPAPQCTLGADVAARAAMGGARVAIGAACGSPSAQAFTRLGGTATITGVGFLDRAHGQSGADPLGDGNDVELHPVLSFSGSCSRGAALPRRVGRGSD